MRRQREASPAAPGQDLDKNIEAIKQTLGDSRDVKLHEFVFGPQAGAALLFIDGWWTRD